MVDYLDSFALNNAQLTVTPLWLREETFIDGDIHNIEVAAAASLFYVTFEGTVTALNLNLARIYSEAVSGLYALGETMWLSCSLGGFFVEFSEIYLRVIDSTFAVKVGVKLAVVGTLTTHEPGFEVSSLEIEVNDWNI